MTREQLADKLEELDRAMCKETDAEAESKLGRELAELIEGDHLRMICTALRGRP